MRFKPVVAIDVDGVLRVGAPSVGEYGAGTAAVFGEEITMHQGSFPKYLHGQPPWHEDGVWTDVHWFSRTGADWVRDLVARGVDVRWATTWQGWANTYFAPVLGLPPLPVAVQGGVRRSEESPEWKARILARDFPSRPVLWVDDNVPWPGFDARRRPIDRALTRLQRINGCSGIIPADVREMEQWLELASSPAGHEELRRQRRRDRDREGAQRRRTGWGSEAAYRAWIPVRRRLRTELDLSHYEIWMIERYVRQQSPNPLTDYLSKLPDSQNLPADAIAQILAAYRAPTRAHARDPTSPAPNRERPA